MIVGEVYRKLDEGIIATAIVGIRLSHTRSLSDFITKKYNKLDFVKCSMIRYV